MSDFRWANLRAKVKRNVQLNKLTTVIGDENGNIYHPYLKGYVLVRQLYANGYGLPFPVLGPAGNSVKLNPGTRVKLAQTDDNKLKIDTLDIVGATIDDVDLYAPNAPTLASGTFVGQQSIITALVTPQAIPDLTVSIKAWTPTPLGIYYEFPGLASLDLSGSVPSAGNNCYAVVFLDSDFATTRITSSTPRSIADLPLGAADKQECLDAAPVTSLPLAIIKLYGGQTKILNTDIVHDIRQIVNLPQNYQAQATMSANATVASTAAETSLVGTIVGNMTFAANMLSRVGRQIRIDAWGYVSDTGTPTLQVKLKLGSTVILDSTAITLGSGISNKLWHFVGTLTVQTAGASGKVFAQGQFTQNGVVTDIVTTAQISIDLTASLLADLTAQWSASSSSNTITCTNLTMEILN